MTKADTVELHQFAPAWGINPSPFCNKVETYFRLTGVPFRAVPSDPSTAPKGKLPYIVHQGRLIPDSGQIIFQTAVRSSRICKLCKEIPWTAV
jgi:Glutathione S-transferase N-terminal domain